MRGLAGVRQGAARPTEGRGDRAGEIIRRDAAVADRVRRLRSGDPGPRRRSAGSRAGVPSRRSRGAQHVPAHLARGVDRAVRARSMKKGAAAPFFGPDRTLSRGCRRRYREAGAG